MLACLITLYALMMVSIYIPTYWSYCYWHFIYYRQQCPGRSIDQRSQISRTTVFQLEQYFLNSIMNALENYYRKWAKKEGVDDSALSEWVKAIRHLVSGMCIFYLIPCQQYLNLCLRIRRLLHNWLMYMINMLLFS